MAKNDVCDVLRCMVAGALFDFAAYLTIQEKDITIGSHQHVSPLIDLLRDWSLERNLSLDDADVKNWQDILENLSMRTEVSKIQIRKDTPKPNGDCFENVVVTDDL